MALRRDGTALPIEISISSYQLKEDWYATVMIRDITERKVSEKALQEAKENLSEEVERKTKDLEQARKRIEVILNAITDGIVVLNAQGEVTLANNKFRELYQRIFKTDMPEEVNFSAKYSHILFNTIKRLQLAKANEVATIEPIKGLYLELTDLEDFRVGEEEVGAIIEVRDVTRFIEFENHRRQFVSTTSHELRTPITVIKQSLENYQDYRDKLTPKQEAHLFDAMNRNAHLMSELIEDLLLVSKIDEKSLKLSGIRYRPLDVLNEVIAQLEPRREKKEITVKVDVNRDIQLYGDTKRISQVFRIFIDNALKYSPKKTEVKITAMEDYLGKFNPTKSDGVLLEFADQGRGIHEDDMQYLFQRFFRSKYVIDVPGTGLGLPIAKDLVKIHGGSIFVESEYGKGSSFFIFLPRISEFQFEE
jgi:signal transduction histidine kinase